jgi:TctA family transporter
MLKAELSCADETVSVDCTDDKRRTIMHAQSKLVAVATVLLLAAGTANAGCLKGAVAGGVVGHVAGKHGVAGAAIGCAVGHHTEKKKEKKQKEQQQQQAAAAAASQQAAAPANTRK